MPKMCFSYQPDLPPGIESRAVTPPGLRRMPAGACFSYTADMPRRGWLSCFSYQADVPHRMSTGTCFSDSPSVPPGTGNGNAAPSAPPGLRTMTYSACFRY